MSRCSAIWYEAVSALTTTKSQATPPHDQSCSAWVKVRSKPSPCAAPANTKMMGLSPEIERRHNRRLSHAGCCRSGCESASRPTVRGRCPACSPACCPACRHDSRCGLASVITKAVVRLWMALKFSVLKRSLRRRMPISVADISDAR